MNPTVRDLWIGALTDGSYKRGLYGLRDLDDRYDPVGVLMDLAFLDGVIAAPKKFDKPEAQVFFGYTYDGQAVRITEKVIKWSGLSYWSANRIQHLSDKGMKFDDMAQYIKEKF